MVYGRHKDEYGPSVCMFCEPKAWSSGKAKIGKRSFDDMFGDLN